MKALFLLFLPFALVAQETTAPAQIQSGYRSTLIIEAKARSEDIIKAYELLKREKPTLKISARTYSGQILSNIADITPMPNGTLLLFRIASTQGVKNQFVSVEDVADLFYS
ncbi:MAG: hypothetical protein HW387_1266 [Parachlamydiales bacterium]|nr:hypothetical protein [Parachlamydiales bacterium]